MFVLDGKIQIGDYIFRTISEVEITKSIEELSNTAVIKMPSKFRIRQNNELKYTEEAIKVGDKVTTTLGYEGKYEGVEFVGFVKKIGSKIPLEIQCEDAIYLLRRKNINKAFGTTTLKEILQEVVSGTDISLSNKIPAMPIDKFIIKNANGAQVLQKLKEDPYGLSVYLDDEGKLYAGLEQVNNIGKEAIYDLNYNLVSNDLEYNKADEKKIQVVATYKGSDNKTKKYTIGDEGGEKVELNYHNVSDEKLMKELAEEALKKRKYDGFEGSVKSFLLPFATPGMAAVIRDEEHKNREGKYFIKKVVTTFGTDGARRTVTIANKL